MSGGREEVTVEHRDGESGQQQEDADLKRTGRTDREGIRRTVGRQWQRRDKIHRIKEERAREWEMRRLR